MNCKDTEKMIPAFLGKELDYNKLDQFLQHVENCPECMEELTIQYLVMTGATLLEEGKSFDLRKVLNALISEAEMNVRRRKRLTVLSYILEALAIIIVVIILIVVILL